MSKLSNSCFTYFNVIVNNIDTFDLKVFCEKLELDYEEMKDYYSDRMLQIGFNSEYKIDINDMVRETLKDLFGKEKILVKLAEEYDLEYFLERVPTIIYGTNELTPILGLDMDIVDFLHYTNTRDDLDYYLLPSEYPDD